jgi:hypothetical protein
MNIDFASKISNLVSDIGLGFNSGQNETEDYKIHGSIINASFRRIHRTLIALDSLFPFFPSEQLTCSSRVFNNPIFEFYVRKSPNTRWRPFLLLSLHFLKNILIIFFTLLPSILLDPPFCTQCLSLCCQF